MTLTRRVAHLERRLRPPAGGHADDDDRPILAPEDLTRPIIHLLGHGGGFGSECVAEQVERFERHAAELRQRDPERLGQLRALDLFVSMLLNWVRERPSRGPSAARHLAGITAWGEDGRRVADAIGPLLDDDAAAEL